MNDGSGVMPAVTRLQPSAEGVIPHCGDDKYGNADCTCHLPICGIREDQWSQKDEQSDRHQLDGLAPIRCPLKHEGSAAIGASNLSVRMRLSGADGVIRDLASAYAACEVGHDT